MINTDKAVLAKPEARISNLKTFRKAKAGGPLLCYIGLIILLQGSGYLGSDFNRVFGALVYLSGLFLCCKPRRRRLVSSLSVILLFGANTVIGSDLLFVGSLLVFGIAIIYPDSKYRYRLAYPLLVIYLLYLITSVFPILTDRISELTAFITLSISGVLGSPVKLGATYFGLFPLAVVTILAMSSPSIKWRSKCGIGLLVVSAWIILVSVLGSLITRFLPYVLLEFPVDPTPSHQSNYLPQALSFVPMGLFIPSAYAILKYLTYDSRSLSFNSFPPRHLIVMAFLGLFTGCLPYSKYIFSESKSPSQVYILDSKLADFNRPSMKGMGLRAAGMFGLFDEILNKAGHRTSHISKISDLPDDKSGILVIINPLEIDNEDILSFHRFVKSGGSALVLGDHTDMEGIKRNLDHLLEPLGLIFRFDSAFPITQGWQHKISKGEHPLFREIDNVNVSLQQGTGASLNVLNWSWRPLITGRFAFSDLGNRMKMDDGFLGDYTYQPGERIGDVLIVAERQLGEGKIIVFGDTSAFQSIAMIHTKSTIIRLFGYLNSPNGLQINGYITTAAFLLVVGIGSWMIQGSYSKLLVYMCSILLGINVGRGVTGCSKSSGVNSNVAIDATKFNAFTLNHWKNESIDGCIINIWKNGKVPYILRKGHEKFEPSTKVHILISPMETISSSESKTLVERVENGIHLIISAGPQSGPQMREISKLLGFQITELPLGPVPIRPKMDIPEFAEAYRKPQFSQAWHLNIDQNWKSLYAYEGHSIVGQRRVGKGKVTVIADPYFLLDRNLEGEAESWIGNVYFFSELLEE